MSCDSVSGADSPLIGDLLLPADTPANTQRKTEPVPALGELNVLYPGDLKASGA